MTTTPVPSERDPDILLAQRLGTRVAIVIEEHYKSATISKLMSSEVRIAGKRGRPRRFTEHAWFGMKVTPDERDAIKRFAQLVGKPQSRAVVDLVMNALRGHHGKLTSREIMELEPAERERILNAQARRARKIYATSEVR